MRPLHGWPYRFILVELNDYADAARDRLALQADAFAAALGPGGILVRTFREYRSSAAMEFRSKEWQADVEARLRADRSALILVIDTDFADFQPDLDRYAIIWLSDYIRDPDALDELLVAVAAVTEEGDDPIAWIEAQEESNRLVARRGSAARSTARVASYVDVHPKVLGFGVDVKAILRDFANWRRSRRS
jgi:hypothetical protein